MAGIYEIRFFGTFSVLAPDGRDVTPRGSKARAVLALLASAQDMRRGRRWLEDKLWSDRSQTQASGSLRQTLSQIRAALPDEAVPLFQASRLNAWLDPKRVRTDLDPAGGLVRADREMFEGLTVRDPEFVKWKADLAVRHMRPAASPLAQIARPRDTIGLVVRTAPAGEGPAAERITGQILADQVAKSLEERFSVLRYAWGEKMPAELMPDIEVRCDVAEDGGRAVAFLRVENGTDGRVMFSDYRSVAGPVTEMISAETITGLAHSAASRILHRLPAMVPLDRPETAAAGYASLGMRKMAQFDGAALQEARQYFRQAYEADGNGVYLAWQAFVRIAQLNESGQGADPADREETDALLAQALESAPDNALAVSLVALTRIGLQSDPSDPADLAMQAIQYNQYNLFAQQTLALAHSALGNPAEAYRLSTAARRAEPDDDLSHLWDLFHALVCISAGRLDEARHAAARSSLAAPGFITPRRQLVALCAHAGDIKGARRYLRQIQALEPGFTLDRFLTDPQYPVPTLRRAGLISPLRKDALIG
ncbi:hypothetical protein [Marinovum sp.]|uniref:hypothetical protein n=1 Tax=Marinovum sp. TaxID=2024839 RepID=UPI002B26AB55|nr:hypothetical protein [Marinovum sp.]